MKDDVNVRISPLAILKILLFSALARENETGGALIGREDGDTLLVVDAEQICETSSRTRVVVDPVKIAEVAERLERIGKGDKIVGWWHSHPGYGADFFSSVDISTQKSYQSMYEKAVALVIDPMECLKRGELRSDDVKIYRVEKERPKELKWDISREELLKMISQSVLQYLQERSMSQEDAIERKLAEVINELRTLNVLVFLLSILVIGLSLALAIALH